MGSEYPECMPGLPGGGAPLWLCMLTGGIPGCIGREEWPEWEETPGRPGCGGIPALVLEGTEVAGVVTVVVVAVGVSRPCKPGPV